jgi:hypothetical protein
MKDYAEGTHTHCTKRSRSLRTCGCEEIDLEKLRVLTEAKTGERRS